MVERLNGRQAFRAECPMRHGKLRITFDLDNTPVANVSEDSTVVNPTTASSLHNLDLTCGVKRLLRGWQLDFL